MPSLNFPACLLLASLAAGCTAPRPTALTPAQSGAATLGCAQLAQDLNYPGLKITGAQQVPDGSLTVPGIASAMPEHCVISGQLHERISPVDGKRYAIGFEMRLPTAWNGRFFYLSLIHI